MTTDPTDLLNAVPLSVAAERSGLDPASIAFLTTWMEPDPRDPAGGPTPTIRTFPGDDGPLVSLEDCILMAPAVRAIMGDDRGGGGRWRHPSLPRSNVMNGLFG